MNINVKRLADAGIASGGHAFSADDDDYFECPQQVAALRMTFSFVAEDVSETAEGMSVAMFMTRDEAHEFAEALVACVCDG